MSTQIARGSIASSIGQTMNLGINPRRRRFGYNPGVLWMQMETRDSGWQGLIPAGQLIPFLSTDLKDSNFDITASDWKPTVMKEFTAKWFIENVKTRYGEVGFIELESLTPLEDEPFRDSEGHTIFETLPDAYFAALHPPVDCPFDGERATADKGVCVTCRLESLNALNGDFVGLDVEVISRLKDELLRSATAFQEYCTIRWAEITGELEERHAGRDGLPALKKGEHHIRRHLHQVAPAELPALAAAAHGQATGELFMTGLKELADAMRESKPDDTVAQATLQAIQLLGEQQAQIARAQLQQGEVIARLLEQDSDKKTKEKVK